MQWPTMHCGQRNLGQSASYMNQSATLSRAQSELLCSCLITVLGQDVKLPNGAAQCLAGRILLHICHTRHKQKLCAAHMELGCRKSTACSDSLPYHPSTGRDMAVPESDGLLLQCSECEIKLEGEEPWQFPGAADDLEIIHTPGHTYGHIVLLHKPSRYA